MEVAEKDQSYQMQQLISTKQKDSTLKLYAGKTYNSLIKASSEEMIQQLNQ